MTDKFTAHSYDRVYPLLCNVVPPLSNILEVGVQGGYSLLHWEALFPLSAIIGLDVAPQPATIAGHKAIRFVQCDAYCEDTVKALAEAHRRCGLVIDDGSHKLEHMCFFAKYYPIFLKPGSVLVIEDLQSPEYFKHISECLPDGLRQKAFMIDLRNIKNRSDDIMLVAYA